MKGEEKLRIHTLGKRIKTEETTERREGRKEGRRRMETICME